MSLCTFHNSCCGSHEANGDCDKAVQCGGREGEGRYVEVGVGVLETQLTDEASPQLGAGIPQPSHGNFIITCAECDYYDCFLIHIFTICG